MKYNKSETTGVKTDTMMFVKERRQHTGGRMWTICEHNYSN